MTVVLLRYEIFTSLYLTMIYKTLIQDAFIRGVMNRETPEERPKITLKRKVGYVEEQFSATRAKMAKMQIDTENVGPQMESETLTNELD